MEFLVHTLVFIIVLEHISFFILESFLWTTERTVRVFGLKNLDFAKETKVLAANQGVYNLFLAAGLFISYFENDLFYVKLFLGFIFLAGIVGSITTKKSTIFVIQGVPALITFLLFLFM